jgi:aminopeptidase
VRSTGRFRRITGEARNPEAGIARDPRVALLAPHELERYADAVVRACLALEQGELLIVRALPDQRELAVALAEAGYRAEARFVDVVYDDPRARAARIRYAREDDLGSLTPWERRRFRAAIEPTTANVTIIPISEPGVFDGLVTERVAVDHARAAKQTAFVRRASQRGRRRWTGVAWPTPGWAAEAYPELAPDDAQRRLARDLLWFCRLGDGDGVAFEGWTAHADRLAERATRLTELGLARLELRGPGTALDVGLAPQTRWLGGPREEHGRPTSGNFPTEENFTSPDPRATEGTFRCSRPLSFRGRTIDGIAGEFRRGRLTRLEAARADDRDFLAAALAVDRGARRLGEVALVDRSSRIGQTARIYFNTLIDENAAAHIAFGSGFDQARAPGERTPVNTSTLHLDVMIGTDDFEATGVTTDGRRVPLLADGTWQV